MSNYFEVNVRGIKAHVEPANGTLRWEINFDHDDSGDWRSLGVGNFPETSLDAARQAAVRLCRVVRPGVLAGLRMEAVRINKRIKELEAE